MRQHLIPTTIVLLTASPLAVSHAQRLHTPLPSVPPPATVEEQGALGESVVGGLVLGGGGFLLGAGIASVVAQHCTSSEYCVWEAAFYGAAAGGTFGMAAGVHLGNGRRGNVLLDFLTAAAVWSTGIGITAASHWNNTVTYTAFVSIPIAQLAATIAVERALGRR